MNPTAVRIGLSTLWLALALLLQGGALLNAAETAESATSGNHYAWKPDDTSHDSFSRGSFSVFQSNSNGGQAPSFGTTLPVEDNIGRNGRSRSRSRDRGRNISLPTSPNRGTTPARPPLPNDTLPTLPIHKPVDEEKPISESEKLQQRITNRYQDPLVTRFLQTLTTQQAVAMYQEVSQMIDTRHMQPTSYQVRVRQALANLNAALDNRAFRDANRVTASATQISNFRRALSDLETRQSASNMSSALNIMQQAMNLAGQQLGLNPNAVALEFVYGAAEAHDVYSTFLPPERSSGPSASLNDHVVGIGVEIKPHDKGLEIVKVLPGGPAHDARLQAGDLIVAVDGRNLAGLSLAQSADHIAGASGSRVVLTVNRGTHTGTVAMTRRSVKVMSVTDVKMIDDAAKVAYMKLDRFSNSSSDEMDEALWSLHRQGMESLVLDLRGNPGGLLTSAIQIANKFLPRGTIVSTKGRTAGDNTHESASFEQTWRIPLVVLIDKNSASASEILAAAIQDNGRGVVVGRQSYGKGTVQTQFSLRSVSGGLRLTTAKFYSPNGREIAGHGVTPDLNINESTVGFGNVAGLDRDTQAALGVAKSPLLKELAANYMQAPARQNAVQPQGTPSWLMAGSK